MLIRDDRSTEANERIQSLVETIHATPGPVMIICSRTYSNFLTDYLMNKGHVEDTGAFGLEVCIDNRFPAPVVVGQPTGEIWLSEM